MDAVRPFLHEVSLAASQAVLIPTSAEALRAQSFLDGRTDFSRAPTIERTLEQFLNQERAEAPPARFLFHVGFCGSTLLSRLLDRSGTSLVLREPHCLANLANQRAGGSALQALLPPICRHFSRPWATDESVVIKPSNWANALLSELAASVPMKALFLTSSRQEFLTAVLRGGSERLAFAARAAAHLAGPDARLGAVVHDAVSGASDPAKQLARLAVACHEVQVRLFRAAAEIIGADRCDFIDAGDLRADPHGAAEHAARVLELGLDRASIEDNVSAWARHHAKDPSATFSPADKQAEDCAVEREFGNLIEDSLDWAASAFPAD